MAKGGQKVQLEAHVTHTDKNVTFFIVRNCLPESERIVRVYPRLPSFPSPCRVDPGSHRPRPEGRAAIRPDAYPMIVQERRRQRLLSWKWEKGEKRAREGGSLFQMVARPPRLACSVRLGRSLARLLASSSIVVVVP